MSTEHYKGEGGVVWAFDPPLPPSAADQVRKGQLVRVPGPDTHAVAPIDGEPAQTDDAEVPGPVAVEQPSRTAAKSLWVDYAVAHGMTRQDADGHTKAELIEQFGD